MKLVLCALVLAACGKEAPPPAKTEPAPRSGKIELPASPGSGGSGMRDGRIPPREGRLQRRERNLADIDTDGDGVVSADERAERVERRMAEMKKRADLDGDGTVSEEEIKAARHDRAQNMFGRLDKDGDGKLTVAEVGDSRMRRFDAAAADADKDGNLTVEEIETAMQNSGPGPWGRRRDRMGGTGAGSGSATP